MSQSLDLWRRRAEYVASRAAAQSAHRYRQYRYDRWVQALPGTRLLREFERARPRAFFVQVGSNDGEQHDPLRATILRSQWRGIMVEPVPYVFDRLRANYGRYADRITLAPVAIGETDGVLPFFHLAPVADYAGEGLPQWYDGIGSFKREHVLKHVEHIPDIETRLLCTEVPTLTFDSLCRRYGVDDVDLLHIDAEGFDFEVIRSIDFDRYHPRLLVYEHYHQSEADRVACRDHVEEQGFETFEQGMDTWCLRRDDERPEERRLIALWDMVKREDPFQGRKSLRHRVAGHPTVRRAGGRAWRTIKRYAEGTQRAELEYWLNVMSEELTPTEWRMLTDMYDTTTPLPAEADQALRIDNPRLAELREEYKRLDLPVTVPSVWSDELLAGQLDLRYFRGENPFVWHYREWPRAMLLKYLLFAQYVRQRDDRKLLERLDEDGAFGCWTFEYPGYPRVSRDLLDSVNELSFLDRHLGILDRPGLRVLDIGAGYGRTAYRMSQAATDLADYCCVDAIPESTFVCEFHLQYRGCTPPARVVPLHEVQDALRPGQFDLALNIHSFSECRYDAVAWWVDRLVHLGVPDLLIVPNDRDELLAMEGDFTRRDFRPLLEAAGFRLTVNEPVIDEPAVRELLRVEDHFLLFHRDV
jgi:FkbM family methyltransferase